MLLFVELCLCYFCAGVVSLLLFVGVVSLLFLCWSCVFFIFCLSCVCVTVVLELSFCYPLIGTYVTLSGYALLFVVGFWPCAPPLDHVYLLATVF